MGIADNGTITGYSQDLEASGRSRIYCSARDVSAVPETSSYALMAVGLLVVGSVARRRRKSRQ